MSDVTKETAVAKAEAKAEKKEIVVGKVFGTAGDGTFSLLVGKVKDAEGKVVGAKFGFHLPYFTLDQLGAEAAQRYANEGQKTVVSNRFAAIFRSSNDYGTDAEAQEMFTKYSSLEGVVAALQRQARVAAEKLDDSTTMAIKILVKALAKQAKVEPKDATKEQKAAWRAKALAWKAEDHKNWQAAYKKAVAAQAVDLVD